jgi:tRNA (adenine22-N1)-methyltransferase
VKSYGMEGKISIRLSDGFQALQDGETDTAVLAGMGGPLIVRLLEQGRRVIHKGYELVLQPQSELDTVRKYLRTHGYSIVQEAMLKEDGKYYTAMKVVKHAEAVVTGVDAREKHTEEAVTGGDVREEALKKIQDLYGAYLMEQHSPVLMEYLETELQKRQKIQKSLLLHTTDKSRTRLAELEQEVDLLQQAIALTKREKR